MKTELDFELNTKTQLLEHEGVVLLELLMKEPVNAIGFRVLKYDSDGSKKVRNNSTAIISIPIFGLTDHKHLISGKAMVYAHFNYWPAEATLVSGSRRLYDGLPKLFFVVSSVLAMFVIVTMR